MSAKLSTAFFSTFENDGGHWIQRGVPSFVLYSALSAYVLITFPESPSGPGCGGEGEGAGFTLLFLLGPQKAQCDNFCGTMHPNRNLFSQWNQANTIKELKKHKTGTSQAE